MSDMGVDVERLEAYLKSLSYASRLELLLLLRRPRTMDEIALTPGPAQPGNPERTLTRQAIQNHLDKLVETGLVRVGSTQRKGKRGVNEYTLDLSRLFAIIEELRKIATLAPAAAIDPLATESLAQTAEPAWEEGPKLVIVHGIGEGTAHTLRSKDLRPPRGWILGRGDECAVRLEYDPYVSTENAEILRDRGAYHLLDLRSSRNGTFLNWKRLPPGGEALLRPGDIVGVGRSLLLFRDA